MSWFKVDDKFHGHPKVKRIPREQRAEAIGTWTLAGTWSADHEQDGYVPAFMIAELGGTEAGCAALVDARLWKVKRDGFQFVNWAKWQPTREENEKKREAARDRQRRHRAGVRTNTDDSNAGVTRDTSEVRAPRPVPSRPDPTKDNQSIGDPPSAHTATGSDPVNAELEKIAARVLDLTGRTIHPAQAALIREHYADRAKDDPRNPTRYALVCLTREDPIVLQNYLDTGRWSE